MVRLRPDDQDNPRRSTTHRMNRTVALVTALAAGMASAAGVAQTAGSPPPATAPSTAPAPAPATAHAAVALQVVPAKIAVIEYEQATAATNEGQRALQALQKKFEPQKNQLQALQTEIDSLTKQLQSAPATMSDEEKASRARTIDTKQKQLQRDGDDATATFNAEMQRDFTALQMQIERDPEIRVVLIKAAGERAFGAGADLSWFEQDWATPNFRTEYRWIHDFFDVLERVSAAGFTAAFAVAPRV